METHRYGPAPAQAGDLYLPKAKHPPVVCLLHGGFWRLPYARDQMVSLALDLVGRSYAVWNLEYRRIGEAGGGWPGTLTDVAAGIDYLAELKAKGVDLDLTRAVTVGHSAGGHLALWAAGPRRLTPDSPKPTVRVMAAVGQAPAADLKRIYELGSSNHVALELTGGTPAQFPERYRAASPRALLPLGVPQLVVHGSADDTVLVDMGRDYVEAALAAGDDAEFVEVKAAGHFEHLNPNGSAWAAVTVWLERMFET